MTRTRPEGLPGGQGRLKIRGLHFGKKIGKAVVTS
jgi:hypothetical protein